MDVTGKILIIEDTVQISDKFRKREFVIEYATNPQYPEYIKFEIVQDKCELLDNFQVGQQIQVFFDLRGRKWTDRQGVVKYFNSLQAWRINADEESPAPYQPPQQQAPEPASVSAPLPPFPGSASETAEADEIPF